MEFLKRFWEAWKKFGHLMGDIIGRLVLTIFYFTIFLPFGLLVRLFGDRLDLKEKPAIWHNRETTDLTLNDARKLT
ncbi:MAG: hypothetical protein ACE5FD_19585 [Anaerolineae bacterium]